MTRRPRHFLQNFLYILVHWCVFGLPVAVLRRKAAVCSLPERTSDDSRRRSVSVTSDRERHLIEIFLTLISEHN